MEHYEANGNQLYLEKCKLFYRHSKKKNWATVFVQEWNLRCHELQAPGTMLGNGTLADGGKFFTDQF